MSLRRAALLVLLPYLLDPFPLQIVAAAAASVHRKRSSIFGDVSKLHDATKVPPLSIHVSLPPFICCRGGAVTEIATIDTDVEDASLDGDAVTFVEEEDGYSLLAKAVRRSYQSTLRDADDDQTAIAAAKQISIPTIDELVMAFKSLSAAQKAFKGLDGAAHEAYQRTQSVDDVDLNVVGRAQRSVARTTAVAVGLGACELCEALESSRMPPLTTGTTSGNENEAVESMDNEDDPIATTVWTGRQVVLNVTTATQLGYANVSVLVLYESLYRGGAGERHGGVVDDGNVLDAAVKRGGTTGRLLIAIGDGLLNDLNETLRLLQQEPRLVRRRSKNKDGDSTEDVMLQPSLYRAAAAVLHSLEPTLQVYGNATTCIHLVGRSLSGGIAALAAAMLNGDIPIPNIPRQAVINESTRKKPKRGKDTTKAAVTTSTSTNSTGAAAALPLSGLGSGRTSAVSLGAPPCLSSQVDLPYVTSIMFGDDIVCRLSPHSMKQFLQRTKNALQHPSSGSSGLLGTKQLNWMTNTLSLTASTLQSQVLTSKKEKATRLAWAGNVYLIRPRRLGGSCSMHEVSKTSREGLRAAMLWQLNDVLLSRSMWKHHQLESYIHGLDRVHLRGLESKEIST